MTSSRNGWLRLWVIVTAAWSGFLLLAFLPRLPDPLTAATFGAWLGGWLLVAALPALAVLGLGYATAWVYRGFRG